jgi:predicted Fe-S protein YdhL (DUF1289 family)
MDEIARWGAMSADEQWEVLHRVAGRRPTERPPVDGASERALTPK